MQIIVGKYAGFCPGVEFTIKKTLEALDAKEKIYCLGEIIHNEYVVSSLKEKGLIVTQDIEEVPNNSKLIIRAHGEPKLTYEKAKERNIEIIDLTCANVGLIHKKVEEKKNDHFIIIIGKPTHPETIGTKGFAKSSFIIEKEDDIIPAYEKFLESKKTKLYVVAQTTFNTKTFEILTEKIKEIFKSTEIIIDNTICNATKIRQQEVIELSKIANKIIIIGGKNSSNTKELLLLAEKNCKACILIQEPEEIKKEEFNKSDTIVILAGASTPKELIEKTKQYLEEKD